MRQKGYGNTLTMKSHGQLVIRPSDDTIRFIRDPFGHVWFLGEDLSRIVGLSVFSNHAFDNLPKRCLAMAKIPGPGGGQDRVWVSVAGAYIFSFQTRGRNAEELWRFLAEDFSRSEYCRKDDAIELSILPDWGKWDGDVKNLHPFVLQQIFPELLKEEKKKVFMDDKRGDDSEERPVDWTGTLVCGSCLFFEENDDVDSDNPDPKERGTCTGHEDEFYPRVKQRCCPMYRNRFNLMNLEDISRQVEKD